MVVRRAKLVGSSAVHRTGGFGLVLRRRTCTRLTAAPAGMPPGVHLTASGLRLPERGPILVIAGRFGLRPSAAMVRPPAFPRTSIRTSAQGGAVAPPLMR
mgnify:CR=1 FL=1